MEKIKEEKRKKILVTGSSGMLGIELCNRLAGEHVIAGLDVARVSGYQGIRVSDFIQCDITDRDKTIKSITDAEPDLVIHAAAWTDVDGCERKPDKAYRINIDGTKNIVTAVSKSNTPLVYISTDFVFDGEKDIPYTERDTPNPSNIYAKSKLEGEREVARLEKHLILRTSWLYGNNGRNFVDTILDIARERNEIKVVDDQTGSPTYTKDFAEAVAALFNKFRISNFEFHDIYHISNKGAVSWFDYAKEILKIAGLDNIKVWPINSKELARPAKRPKFSVLDNTKFEKAANFIMRPWQEALQEYVSEKA